MKQCCKYIFSLNLPYLLLTDGATYQLVLKHPSEPIMFLAPPISDAGLVSSMPGPILCTHKPLGLAVALCARGDGAVLSAAELALRLDIPTAPGRPSTRLTNLEITASANMRSGEVVGSQDPGDRDINDVSGRRSFDSEIAIPTFQPQNLKQMTHLRLRSSWDTGELERIREKALHSFQSGLLLLGNEYLPCRPQAELKALNGDYEPIKQPVVPHALPTPPPSSPPCSIPSSPAADNAALPTPFREPCLQLKRYISSGRVWDVFGAAVVDEHRHSESSCRLAVKVVCPYSPRTSYTVSFASADESRDAVGHEHALYNGALKALQGTAVGAWYGLYSGMSGSVKYALDSEGIETWVAVTELGGRSLPVQQLTNDQKLRVLDAYKALHAAGVLHIDVEPCYWLWSEDESVMLIDFDRAIYLGTEIESGELAWEEAEPSFCGEMDLVRGLLQI